MREPQKRKSSGIYAAQAGGLAVTTLVLCVAIGLVLGRVIGSTAVFVTAAVVVGFGLGFWVVYKRFGDV